MERGTPVQLWQLGELPEDSAWNATIENDLVRPYQDDGVGPLVVLLGGGGLAELKTHLDQDLVIDLLVSYDASVWDMPDVMAQCRDVLTAPFRKEWLHEKLKFIGQHHLTIEPADEILKHQIVGESSGIQALFDEIRSLSGYEVPVLIKGETGTGKELVARAIHYSGIRSCQPFIPVNCGGFTDELFLAELFGYEKGAFTDAKRAHMGLVEQAEGGTLFLDEVDSLSARCQVALLRFLQDREYRRLGGESVRQSDVRIVTATNQCLKSLVVDGHFREDLYFRLDIMDLTLPPLRERGDDIEHLANHFLDQFAKQYKQATKYLHQDTLAWMRTYDWPGNVRELENYLHRLVVLTENECIYVPDEKGRPMSNHYSVPTAARMATRKTAIELFNDAKNRAIERFERQYLHQVMETTGGNVSRAAEKAGKERRAFGRLLKKYGIERSQFVEG